MRRHDHDRRNPWVTAALALFVLLCIPLACYSSLQLDRERLENQQDCRQLCAIHGWEYSEPYRHGNCVRCLCEDTRIHGTGFHLDSGDTKFRSIGCPE